jgi:beta-lactamase regulating signal transducer with metallopeptidase domain
MSVEHFAALICAWLASYFVRSTLLLGTAWVVTRPLSSRFDRLAEIIWRLALGLPVLSAIGELLPHSAARLMGAPPLEFTPPAMTVAAVSSSVWLIVAALWIAGASLGVVRLGLLQRSLRRAIAHRSPVDAGRAIALEGQRGPSSTQISVVDGLSVPLALTNEICLPLWVVERMDRDEYRAVVAHELAHVRRRDAVWRPLTSLVTRIFFFQPLNWLAGERLRELSECICDADAIAATKSTLALATALEAVAVRNARRERHLSLAPAMDAGKSFTLRRVLRILSSSGDGPIQIPRSITALAGAVGVAAAMLAPSVTLPAIAFLRYTINAQDPAGRFTLTVERGRVVGATISGRIISPRQVRQDGPAVKIAEPARGVFSLTLTPAGGIRWDARRRGT